MLIDLKMTDDRQIPVEKYAANRLDIPDLAAFNKEYESEALEKFRDIAARHGLGLPQMR